MTETHTRGTAHSYMQGGGIVSAIAAVIFIMLWIATDDVKNAALVTLAAILVGAIVFLVIWSHHTGARQANETATAIVASMAAMVTARSAMSDIPNVVKPTPGNWIVNGSTMQLEERVQSAAQKVYLALKPQNIPPTRENIRKVTGESSHEFAATVIDWLAERGHVDAKGQGAAPMWRKE